MARSLCAGECAQIEAMVSVGWGVVVIAPRLDRCRVSVQGN